MPKPAEPPRPGSRHSVTDIVAPNAVHELRPVPAPDARPTAPPPRPDPRPMPRSSMVGVKAPPPAASEPPDDIRDSREITTDALLKEAADRAAKLRAAEAAGAAKDAEIERLKLEAAAREQPEKFDPVAYFTRFQVIALKILLPIAALAAAGGVTLGIYNKATIEPKVDRAVKQQDEQKTKTVTVEDRILAIEKYGRAHAKWASCMNAQRDSAIERGTGHKTESEHDDVQWVEQNKPSTIARPLWKTAPWSIAKEQGCGAEPAPPSTPPSTPPP